MTRARFAAALEIAGSFPAASIPAAQTNNQTEFMGGFIHLLTEQARESDPDYALLSKIDAAIADAVKAATDPEKAKATGVAITLKFTPAGSRGVNITGEVSTKLPKQALPASLFFADDEGNLSRNNPRQRVMEFSVEPSGETSAPVTKKKASS